MRKIIYIALLTILVIVGFGFFLYKPEAPTFNTGSLLSSNSRYVLTAEGREDYGKYPIYFPPVSSIPGFKKYTFVKLYEQYQLLTHQQTLLFFASKRINELVKWVSILPTDNSVRELSQLYLKQKKAGTFESVLSDYMRLIDEEFESTHTIQDETTKSNRLYELKRYIYQHRKSLDSAVFDSSIPNDKKRYLSFLVNLVFDYYYKKTNLSLTENTPGIFNYSLTLVKFNFDYGLYNLYIDQKDIEPFQNKASVSNGSINYQLQKDNKHIGIFDIKNILVTPTTSKLQLRTSEYARKLITWDAKPQSKIPFQQNKINFYTYSIDISDTLPERNVDLVFSYVLPKGTIISLDFQPHKLHVFDHEVTSEKEEKVIRRSVIKNAGDSYILTIYSKTKLNSDLLSNVFEHITLVDAPKIVIEKNKALVDPVIWVKTNNNAIEVTANHVSNMQKKILTTSISNTYKPIAERTISPGNYVIIFEPKLLILFKRIISMDLFLLCFTLVVGQFLKRKNLDQFGSYFSTQLKTFKNKIVQSGFMHYVQTRQRYILLCMIVLILFDIVVLNFTFDPFTILICLLLFIMSLVTKLDKLFFTAAIIAMVSALFLYLIGWEIPYKKASDWAFTFLIFALIRSALDILFNL